MRARLVMGLEGVRPVGALGVLAVLLVAWMPATATATAAREPTANSATPHHPQCKP